MGIFQNPWTHNKNQCIFVLRSQWFILGSLPWSWIHSFFRFNKRSRFPWLSLQSHSLHQEVLHQGMRGLGLKNTSRGNKWWIKHTALDHLLSLMNLWSFCQNHTSDGQYITRINGQNLVIIWNGPKMSKIYWINSWNTVGWKRQMWSNIYCVSIGPWWRQCFLTDGGSPLLWLRSGVQHVVKFCRQFFKCLSKGSVGINMDKSHRILSAAKLILN